MRIDATRWMRDARESARTREDAIDGGGGRREGRGDVGWDGGWMRRADPMNLDADERASRFRVHSMRRRSRSNSE